MWFGLAVVIMAIALAGTGLVVLSMIGRGVSLVVGEPLHELPVWGWAGWVAGGFVVFGLVVTVLSVALSVLRHGADRILRDTGAVPVEAIAPDHVYATRLRNVVDALCLGLGVGSPRLAVIDDPAPNALSVSTSKDETLIVTSGLLDRSRDEVEAVAAHELAHLHARDARWVTAAAASLGRTRGVAHLLEGVAGLLLVLFWAGTEAEVFLITPLLGGLGIGFFALIMNMRVGAAQRRVRSESDEIADVAAVLLARNPAALASVCAHLSQHPGRVRRTSWRADHLWFAPLPEVETSSTTDDKDTASWFRRQAVSADGRRVKIDAESASKVAEELAERAIHAYHAAGIPVPAPPPPPQAPSVTAG